MNQKVFAVIGANFGDEGKGLATDLLCGGHPSCAVIKHNGGAQAGHTVHRDGKRFVFHQLSSGSFCGADTLFADTYYADLYKLSEEACGFRSAAGFVPRIYCTPSAQTVYFGDVLTNQILEKSRGENRHGSCGMGINEAYLRSRAGFGLTVYDFLSKSFKELCGAVDDIRRKYTLRRLDELGISVPEEYEELLLSDSAIPRAVSVMRQNACEYVTAVCDPEAFLKQRGLVIFESGQGLLLDVEYKKYAPYLTSSHTGLYNPVLLSGRYGLHISNVTYVTRTYVTRHGNGPLPYEFDRKEYGLPEDETNHTNEWQGAFRYAAHGFSLQRIREDLSLLGYPASSSLLFTHADETDGMIITPDSLRGLDGFLKAANADSVFSDLFVSYGRRAADVEKYMTSAGASEGSV